MTWVPEACTLPTAEQPSRVAEFDDLFPAERLHLPLPAGDAAASTARELAARETACCSFSAFAVRPSATVLEVRVPPAQAAVLDAMQRTEAARAGGVGAVTATVGTARRAVLRRRIRL